VGVEGEKNRIGEQFRHANKAGVGKAHRHIRVFDHQVDDVVDLLIGMERANQCAAVGQAGEFFRVVCCQDVKGLG
jgi:hypothetical protein